MGKDNWIQEQASDEDIGPMVELVPQGKHLQYTCKEGDPSGMRVLLKPFMTITDTWAWKRHWDCSRNDFSGPR